MRKSTIDGELPGISFQKSKSFNQGEALHSFDNRGAFGSRDMSLVEVLTKLQCDYSLAVDEIDQLKKKQLKI